MSDIRGVDVGTMNLVCCKQVSETQVEIKNMRNMFLDINPSMLATTEIANTQLDYAVSKDDNGEADKIYILGEDAYKFGNIFGQEVKRPMSKGVISSKEFDAIEVLTFMMEKLIGRTTDGKLIYSIPAQAIDIDTPSILYHEKIFGRIFQTLGYESKPLNEAMGIIFSECSKTNFTGIAISFGAGMTNVACAYKGTPTLTFSVARGGDWLDNEVSASLGTISTRVTSIKEKELNLANPNIGKKKEKVVREALCFYYRNLIEYVLKHIVAKFEENSDGLQIDEEIPIVVSGGTSLANGFVDAFKEVFAKFKDFPYEISEIRSAVDPLSAVAQGALVYALWQYKEKPKEEEKKEEKKGEEI